MEDLFVGNILAVALFLVSLFICVRAFYTYAQLKSPRLFTLGLAMGIIALTAAADFTSSNFPSLGLNTDWFLFIGQAVSFLFIWLSLLNHADAYLQWLMRLQVWVSVAVLCLLILSPTLPDFTGTLLAVVLSGSRFVICLLIGISYLLTFLGKQTRFSLLMGMAFVLLGFGYLLIAQKFSVSNLMLFDNAGDGIRLGGLLLLLVAMLVG
jgi:hypothetical protein